MMSISMIDFASIVAIIMAMISRKFRQLLMYGISRIIFVFIRKTYVHKSLGNAFLAHLNKNGWKVKKFSGELLGEARAFVKPRNEVQHLLYRDVQSNVQLFYRKGSAPIIVSGTPLTYHKDYVKSYAYVVYTLRWTIDIIKLLDSATEDGNTENEDAGEEMGKFYIKHVSGGRFFREAADGADKNKPNTNELANEKELKNPLSPLVMVKWRKEDIGSEFKPRDTFATMSLNQELLDLTDEIEFWHKNRSWYESRKINHRRGVACVGAPGTGKTLYTRALAEKLNIPLIVFNLSSMSDVELIAAWNQVGQGRICLFEDIDTVFDGRKSMGNPELSFETFLAILDGIDKKQGILTIITTNHPEKLDPALCVANGKDGTLIPSRPGRIDRIVEFKPLDEAGRWKLVMRIVQDEVLAKKVADEGVNDSAAQLTERAFRASIDSLFAQRKKEGYVGSNGSNGVPIHKTEEKQNPTM